MTNQYVVPSESFELICILLYLNSRGNVSRIVFKNIVHIFTMSGSVFITQNTQRVFQLTLTSKINHLIYCAISSKI